MLLHHRTVCNHSGSVCGATWTVVYVQQCPVLQPQGKYTGRPTCVWFSSGGFLRYDSCSSDVDIIHKSNSDIAECDGETLDLGRITRTGQTFVVGSRCRLQCCSVTNHYSEADMVNLIGSLVDKQKQCPFFSDSKVKMWGVSTVGQTQQSNLNRCQASEINYNFSTLNNQLTMK